MPADEWISIPRAATRFGRSRQTIYRWAASGKVRKLRIHRETLLNVADLLRMEARPAGRPRAESRET